MLQLVEYMNVAQNRKKSLHEMFLCAFLVTKVLHDVVFCIKVMRLFFAYVLRVSHRFRLFKMRSVTEFF